jgi:biofilm protein TabA
VNICQIDHFLEWVDLHKRFTYVEKWIQAVDVPTLAEGRHDILGDEVYVIVACDQGRGKSASPLEIHRRYIDIQWCLEGHELIGIRNAEDCVNVAHEYDEEKDIAFFSDPALAWHVLDPGMAMIIFPDDAHAPLAGTGPVKKAIFKVAV